MPRILIVDDLSTDRLLMRSLLQSRGDLEIHEAVDGETAFAFCRETRPDLVLLDIVLPHADGFQVCRRLKRDPATATVPVVLVSSKTQESDKFWGLKQGASDYLTKPLDGVHLLDVVNRLVPR